MATLSTSGLVKLRAGVDVNTDLTNDDYDRFIEQAEAQLVADTRVNWIDKVNDVPQELSGILRLAVSARAAIPAINHDIQAYGSLTIATTMINVNLQEYNDAVSRLKDANIFKPFGGSALKE